MEIHVSRLRSKMEPIHYPIQLVPFLMFASAEALNTAIEILVDRVPPEILREAGFLFRDTFRR